MNNRIKKTAKPDGAKVWKVLIAALESNGKYGKHLTFFLGNPGLTDPNP